MYNAASSDIHGHMAGIADQITRLHFLIWYLPAKSRLFPRRPGNADAEMPVYRLGITGKVCSAGKACTSVYIGIAYKLQGIVCHISAEFSAAYAFHRPAAGRACAS